MPWCHGEVRLVTKPGSYEQQLVFCVYAGKPFLSWKALYRVYGKCD